MNSCLSIRRALLIVAMVLVGCPAPSGTAAEIVSLAAASDLVFCLEALSREFTNGHPEIEIKTSTGSSGNFFAQIKNGAPFDVFLSADMSYPRELVKAGAAEESTLREYAIGRIVLWTTRTNLALTNGLLCLKDSSVKRIAIANPDHAPYGRAARAALQHVGLWESIQPRLVLGENISQTLQFVQTGNADAGIVALSLVMSPKMAKAGRYVEVPAEMYPPLQQGAVLTRQGRNNPAARTYLNFLQTAKAREIFDRHGFRLPKHKEPVR